MDFKKKLETQIKKQNQHQRIIALIGNPNVGKSTIFNGLTGMNQHTGNWPGKTVTSALGEFEHQENKYTLVDLPGTYSLVAHSKEEEVTRDFIYFGSSDCIVIVCDATCLKRNLNLVLQTLEVSNRVILCVNLLDEAKKKNLDLDLNKLETILKIPVIGTVARNKSNLRLIPEKIEELLVQKKDVLYQIVYHPIIELALDNLVEVIKIHNTSTLPNRFIAIQCLEQNQLTLSLIRKHYSIDLLKHPDIRVAVDAALRTLRHSGFTNEKLIESLGTSLNKASTSISEQVVQINNKNYMHKDRMLDRFFTSKLTGYPIMLLLLLVVFWITIVGANVPSQMLSNLLFSIEQPLINLFKTLYFPSELIDMLVFGLYRVLAWVISVMLPPMAIFFPMFTLLEDFGYLPRIAFNLDNTFKKCHACGKQALTMCMGFGCNAVGVTGTRIIDSQRERLIAIITNNFVPCNGRFPTIITLIAIFFTLEFSGLLGSFYASLLLTSVILLGIFATFIASFFLSKTILKGEPSSFALELPPYRRPQFVKVVIRSVFDRTLFVLGRAVIAAIPAGIIIWLLSNIMIGEITLMQHFTLLLDPIAKIIGLDGVILLAFILGFPANEIVMPIIIMIYMSNGTLMELDSTLELRHLLINNGWTWLTALNTILFSLMHWPCATTCITIRKESGSLKWVLYSIFIPTLFSILLCLATTLLFNLL